MLKKAIFVLSIAVLAMFGLGMRCGAHVEESRNPAPDSSVAHK